MHQEHLEDTIRRVMSVVLGHPIMPGQAVARLDEPSWDSLKHVELLFAIESAFNITFNPEEIPQLDDLKKFVEGVIRHLAA